MGNQTSGSASPITPRANVVASAARSSTFILVTMTNFAFQPPHLEELSSVDTFACSAACNGDDDCDGYNYFPGLHTCQLVTVSMDASAIQDAPGGQIWLREGLDRREGVKRIALHPDGNTYAAFLDWNTSLTAARDFCATKLRSRLAPVTSLERLNYFETLLGPNASTLNAGLWDHDFDGIFTDSREFAANKELQISWNSYPWLADTSTSCLAIVFKAGSNNSFGNKPYYNKTDCGSNHPWICELTNPNEGKGCWMEPPVPIGAKVREDEPRLPAKIGHQVFYECPNGERFVNDNMSPRATCRRDGYWRQSYPFYPCTGGPNFMYDPSPQDPMDRTCYKVDMQIQVAVGMASKYCQSMGGGVLSFSNASRVIFNELPVDLVTGKHFNVIFSGFVNQTNVVASGDLRDAEGNAVDFLEGATYDDDDDSPNENYLILYRGSSSSTWTVFDDSNRTIYPRIICKFSGC